MYNMLRTKPQATLIGIVVDFAVRGEGLVRSVSLESYSMNSRDVEFFEYRVVYSAGGENVTQDIYVEVEGDVILTLETM